jgi:hypothetical protein
VGSRHDPASLGVFITGLSLGGSFAGRAVVLGFDLSLSQERSWFLGLAWDRALERNLELGARCLDLDIPGGLCSSPSFPGGLRPRLGSSGALAGFGFSEGVCLAVFGGISRR